MKLPNLNRTIIALATPPGKGALAVLRMTGKKSFSIFSKLSSDKFAEPKHKQVSLVKIKDEEKNIDDAVVVFFCAPHSYTGENTVEIMCHGSPYIAREIINAAIKFGAASAEPGEFTLRAFLNGKIDLAGAEAVNALISSASMGAHHAALTQLHGGLSASIENLRKQAVELLAELEARLDEADGEPAYLDNDILTVQITSLKNSILHLAHSFKAGKGLREGIKVVLAGAPNAGKSSLLNALLGFDRAIVSNEPGTTRDTLEADIDIAGFTVHVTDTAGLSDQAGSCIEEEGMQRTVQAMNGADFILLLKDCSQPASEADSLAFELAKKNLPNGAEIIKVLSKSDIAECKPKDDEILLSCKTGYGLEKLKHMLVRRQEKLLRDGDAPAILFARHYEALKNAASELEKVLPIVQQTEEPPLEIAAEHLRAALNYFGQVTGETASDEVLSKIFSTFCVGK